MKIKDLGLCWNIHLKELYGKYTERRICMMAGIAGGNGYFGEGWAVADFEDVDNNLIIDEPTHWKYI